MTGLPRWSAVPDEPLPRHVVAAFDVDHTVTSRDCVVPFMRRVAGRLPFVARLGLAAARNVSALARRDRDHLKAAIAHAVFAGRSAAEVEQLGEAFAAELVEDGLRPDTMARMRWHHEQGHDVLFVSASFAAYLQPLARRLGVITGVLCTELVVGPDGRYTGELLGGNCRGQAKVHRLHAWLAEHRGGRTAVDVWAYGDSPGDVELLFDADHPVWTDTVLESPGPVR
jgi:phosphatidylglycerophosphatase C